MRVFRSDNIFTCPYHPQRDGLIERYNRTLAKCIRPYISTTLDDWDEHIAIACFRYNRSVNDATGMTPYRAVFGIDAFDFDAEVGKRKFEDDELASDESLKERLAKVHRELIEKGIGERMVAARQYKKSSEKLEFKVVDRVMIYHPPLDKKIRRKLKPH